MATQILDEQDIRRIVRDELRRPVYVHQRCVEAVIGLPRREYLIGAHASAFPWTKQRRLIVARTVDVIAWLELRLVHRDGKPSNDASTESTALARVGARRVG